MARDLAWKQLSVGLVGLGVVAALAAGVLLFAQVGGVRGAKTRIYVTAAGARGVLKGTNVLVAGKLAGSVTDIRFLPPESDTTARLVIDVDLLESALPLLRRNSQAQIRPSGTIIGAPVIDLTAGTTAAPPLQEGDTVTAARQVTTERVADRVGELGEEFGAAMQDWRSIMADVQNARGTFGAIRVHGPRDLAAFRTQAASLAQRLTSGRGSAGLLMRDPALRSRAASALARADSIGQLLGSDAGTVGRFRKDQSLSAAMEATRSELAQVSRALREASGTAGRVQQDRALADQLDELSAQLDVLIEDFKANPLRYISF